MNRSLRSIANGAINTHAVRNVRGFTNRQRVRTLIAHERPFTIDIGARMGLGAVALNALLLQEHFRGLDARAALIASNPLYVEPGGDVLANVFSWRGESGPVGAVVRYRFPQDLMLAHPGGSTTFQRLRDAARESIDLDRGYGAAARAVIDGGDEPFIGAHYRGSDKHAEADPVNAEDFLAELAQVVSRTGIERIFLGTDEPAVLNEVVMRFPGAITLKDQALAVGVTPPHFTGADPVLLSRDAATTMLILSKATYLLRTASNLSLVSALLAKGGTSIRTINRSRSYTSRFLEDQLFEHNDTPIV